MAEVFTLQVDGRIALEGKPGVVTYITDEALHIIKANAQPGDLLDINGTEYRLGHYRVHPNAHEVWQPAQTPGVGPQA